MKFKFLTVVLIALFSISSVLTSCGKYEEGPSFTLLTKKMRVTGEWTLTAVNNDEVDALLGVETILFFDGDGIFMIEILPPELRPSYTDDEEYQFQPPSSANVFSIASSRPVAIVLSLRYDTPNRSTVSDMSHR